MRTGMRIGKEPFRVFGLALYQSVVGARGEAEDQRVHRAEAEAGDERAQEREAGVVQGEGLHCVREHGGRERRMEQRDEQRQEEHEQNLLVDRPLYLAVAHPDLLQDDEAVAILVALRHLLEVDDEHGVDQKQQREEHAQEDQPAEERVAVQPFVVDVVEAVGDALA